MTCTRPDGHEAWIEIGGLCPYCKPDAPDPTTAAAEDLKRELAAANEEIDKLNAALCDDSFYRQEFKENAGTIASLREELEKAKRKEEGFLEYQQHAENEIRLCDEDAGKLAAANARIAKMREAAKRIRPVSHLCVDAKIKSYPADGCAARHTADCNLGYITDFIAALADDEKGGLSS